MGVKFSQLKPSKYFGLLHHTPYVNDFQTFNKYLQSYYPTTVLSEKIYDILGVSIYSDPSYIFSGDQDTQLPRIYAPVLYREYFVNSHDFRCQSTGGATKIHPALVIPRPYVAYIGPKSRTERPRKTKIGSR